MNMQTGLRSCMWMVKMMGQHLLRRVLVTEPAFPVMAGRIEPPMGPRKA